MTKYLIKKLREGLAAGHLKDVLKKLHLVLEGDALANELILINSRYNKLESDNRMGILSYDDYLLNTNKISNAILGVIGEIEQDKERSALLRQYEKQVLFAQYIKLTVDFSVFLAGKSKAYRGNEFIDIDDFLNELYFEIKDAVAPGSFRREWTLRKKNPNSDTLEDIDDQGISRLLNDTYSTGERAYMHDELEAIYRMSDAQLVICKL